MSVLGFFAQVALILAGVGIYGVVSYQVAQRTREIGVRLALGAGTHRVLKHVFQKGLVLIMLGLGVGVPAALALTRVLSSLLFGVSASDPLTFAAVILLLVAVALLAIYIPARRATRVDPLVAMRAE
jgi:ABC-type antimicrobial peptide transport system permease subunit